jgi:uncharacterized circularly permuted ATP-grasp superfamily protein
MDLDRYDPETPTFFDEMYEGVGRARPEFRPLIQGLVDLGSDSVLAKQRAAEQALLKAGITFTLGTDSGDGERIFPFDIIPRVVSATDWERIERGIRQRLEALNLFLSDVYGPQKILKDGTVPRSLIETCPDFRKACIGLSPPRGIWCHISGTDLVRDKSGEFVVLEDNLRCPSGVSYVLENRHILKRTLPRLFEQLSVRPVDDYPMKLLEMLQGLAPKQTSPRVVVLTPGRYNSAYFEHAFLAQQMGVDLVQSDDLLVRDDFVYVRTTSGLERVDVIYRRIGDDYLDPEVFRPESVLGIPGLMRAYVKGNVALANAPGTGVADDKAVYAYVEDIVRYYLDQEPILKNVKTYICSKDDDRKYVLEHLAELVVKATDGAGGYGMLIGPHSTQAEQATFKDRIIQNPRGYIAQPTLSLSRVPTLIGEACEPRHVDLRPYALCGSSIYVQPGGLTRVALKKGSLVVNSSQGGGSKDTWVLSK